MKALIAGSAVLVAAVLLLAACGSDTEPAAVPSVLVSTTIPTRGSIPDTLSAYGTAVPATNGRTSLSIQSEGLVVRLYATPGESVAAGQSLLEFELSAAARSAYEQARTALALAREQQERTTRLLAQQLATRDQLAQAEKAATDAQAALTALERQNGGNPHQRIVAPFAGVVDSIPVAQGARVQPGAPLITLTRKDGLVVTVGVEPKLHERVKLGQSATLESLSGSDHPVTGRVIRLDNTINPATHLVDTDIRVDSQLLQGEAFRARIEVGQFQGWVVPRDAYLTDAQGGYVFQVAEGKAVRVAVRLVGTDGNVAVVSGPIDASRRLVTEGNYQLRNGMAVRMADSGRDNAAASARHPAP